MGIICAKHYTNCTTVRYHLHMALKAIFLDWDGVLADSFGVTLYALNKTITHFNGTPPTPGALRKQFGNASHEVLDAYLGPLGPDAKAYFYEVRRSIVQDDFNAITMDGADTLMATLRQKKQENPDLYIGVISNRSQETLNAQLAQSGWGDIIHTAVGTSTTSAKKPEPAMLDQALSAYTGRTPLGREMLYIGDTDVDMAFARATNMRFLGVGKAMMDSSLEDSEKVANLGELNERLKHLIQPPKQPMR
jgi:HAD superfamily hydrolase (TIGR01549 family)